MAENSRILNYQYAPGIATYGIDGAQGEKGEPGTSFFFTSYDLSEGRAGEEVIQFLQKVNTNRQLTAYWDAPAERPYVSGDLVLDVAANIYRINQIDGVWQIPQRVARLKQLMLNDFFGHDRHNRIYLKSADGVSGDKINGLDILVSDNPDAHSLYLDSESSSVLRVISEKKDKSGDYNLVSLITKTSSETKKYLTVKYNENDDTFTMESNADVVLNCKSLSVDYVSGGAVKKGSDRYRVAPYDDNIGLIHYSFSRTYISEIGDDFVSIVVPGNAGDGVGYQRIIPDFIKIVRRVGTNVLESIHITDESYTSSVVSGDVQWTTIQYNGLTDEEVTALTTACESKSVSQCRVALVRGVEVVLNYSNQG